MSTLEIVAIISLVMAGVCVLVVVIDLFRRPQHMWIMNAVWPLTALYAGPIGLWAYFAFGRKTSRRAVMAAKERGEEHPGKRKPEWQAVSTGATHCGSGCTLGDLCGETLVAAAGWTIAGMSIWAAWIVDFAFAYAFGIAFQYFTIKPMKGLSPGEGLVAAVKADTLSLVSWQLGMYGWMALVVFVFFGHELHKTDPVFWFMMQLAMLAGFVTSLPANWWLINKKIKERM